jgi:Tfp pilus assembly protein PilX
MPQRPNSNQSGFALILALLALMLLSTMGLALSSSSTTEMQIASNQRWSEAARYNAEAGIEYGMNLLRTADWAAILPAARTAADWNPSLWNTSPASAATGTAPQTRATRNFENWRCDSKGYGMGYGVVFDDGGAQGPEEFRTDIGGVSMNGAFTLWVRRPVRWNGDVNNPASPGTALEDYPNPDVLVLVSEGVAPFTRGGLTATGQAQRMSLANRAVYTMEVLVSRTGTTVTDSYECNNRQGQAGGAASGGNTSGCVALSQASQVGDALTGITNAGTGALK